MEIFEERKERITALMKEDGYIPLLFNELSVILNVPENDSGLFKKTLDELESEGRIFKTGKGRYAVLEKMNLVVGRLQGNERGYGFVIPDSDNVNDVFIPAENLNGAMHNDRVIARINSRGTSSKSKSARSTGAGSIGGKSTSVRSIGAKSIGGRNTEGEIIKVIRRANKELVGIFESDRNFGFVIPDNKKICGDVFIPGDGINGAKPGQKVVIEIFAWPDKRRNAQGRIIEVIGDSNAAGVDILSIIRSYGLSETFPDNVMQQAETINETVSENDINGRHDLRKLRMVTIDGEDAKDLDDAVSVEKLAGGNYRLGIHIADVSHYVADNSPLDIEALKRGTSVYLVDRVIPMLPEKLSNGICSLNPQADRLAFTVMMDIDENGKVYNHEIFESVINVDERMTYTDVYKILVDKDEQLIKRYEYLVNDFRIMEELAQILRKKRAERGSVDFDFDETKIILDKNGMPVEVKRYEITIANKIIEEFMLVCNETVAEHFYWAESPFVYRVHEDPDSEKIRSFAEFIHNLGYYLKGINKIHPGALQELLEKVKGKKEERIISTIMLRSLQKARYSHLNHGHFGLAAQYYCHFTSPIRRYPDLIIHSIMKEYLNGAINEKREHILKKRLPEIAKICSERERNADEAERETEDLKKVEYMKQHEGETFEGIISNVTSFGMFVELENTIEGLVRMSDMEDDYYVFNEKQYYLVGERRRKIYRIGDTLKVRLAKADIASRQIDFIIVGKGDKETDIKISKRTDKKTDMRTHKRIDKSADTRTDKRIDKSAGKRTDKRTDTRADKGTDKRTDTKTDMKTAKKTDKKKSRNKNLRRT